MFLVPGVATPTDSLKQVLSDSNFTELTEDSQLHLDLRYATSDNFMHTNLYGVFNRAFLHREAAEKLRLAAQALQKAHPGYRFLIWDALRPRSVQWILWTKVRGTSQQDFVADAAKGSVHNFGFAVDLSVIDEKGRELDMGTPFDDFTPRAEAQREEELMRDGQLTQAQLANRFSLRRAMEAAGFIQLPNEWWHYDAKPGDEVRKKYSIVE